MRLALWIGLAFVPLTGCDEGSCKLAGDCPSDQLCKLGQCTPRQEPPPPRTRTVPPIWPDEEIGFLWRIEGSPPSYLLGTIHVGVDPTGFPAAVFGAFDASPLIAIEADIRQPITDATLDRYALLPAGESLEQLLPADVWQLLIARLGNDYPQAQLRTFEPWFVSFFLLAPNRSDLPTMEPALVARAERQGQALGFMETIEDQLSALDLIPREFWIEDIIAVLRDPSYDDGLDELVSAYLAADAEAIAALSFGDPAVEEILLSMRNRNWIPVIEDFHQNGGAFVAVGLAHLLGPDSVIELLRTSGSTVTPVRIDGGALHAARRADGEATPLPEDRVPRPDLTWPWF